MQPREFMYWLKGYLDRDPEGGGMGLRQILDIRQQLEKTAPAAEKTLESLKDEGFIDLVTAKLHETVVFQETPTDRMQTQYKTLHRTLRGALSAVFGEAAPPQTAAPAPARNKAAAGKSRPRR